MSHDSLPAMWEMLTVRLSRILAFLLSMVARNHQFRGRARSLYHRTIFVTDAVCDPSPIIAPLWAPKAHFTQLAARPSLKTPAPPDCGCGSR